MFLASRPGSLWRPASFAKYVRVSRPMCNSSVCTSSFLKSLWAWNPCCLSLWTSRSNWAIDLRLHLHLVSHAVCWACYRGAWRNLKRKKICPRRRSLFRNHLGHYFVAASNTRYEQNCKLGFLVWAHFCSLIQGTCLFVRRIKVCVSICSFKRRYIWCQLHFRDQTYAAFIFIPHYLWRVLFNLHLLSGICSSFAHFATTKTSICDVKSGNCDGIPTESSSFGRRVLRDSWSS